MLKIYLKIIKKHLNHTGGTDWRPLQMYWISVPFDPCFDTQFLHGCLNIYTSLASHRIACLTIPSGILKWQCLFCFFVPILRKSKENSIFFRYRHTCKTKSKSKKLKSSTESYRSWIISRDHHSQIGESIQCWVVKVIFIAK